MCRRVLIVVLAVAALATGSLAPVAVPAGAAVHTVYLPLVARPAPPQVVDMAFEFSQVVSSQDDPPPRAVAFHGLEFIDPSARVLGTLIFGTPEANALQGAGWFGNEMWPDVGSYQWAGGSSRRATVRLTIPPGTEGLLLYVTSAVNGLRMEVKLDGHAAATLVVDGFGYWGGPYWHWGYVPVGPAVPSPPSTAQPQWLAGRAFPHFPAAQRVYAIRVYHELYQQPWANLRDWRITQSHNVMMALTLAGLQGLINRTTPGVYLSWSPSAGSTSSHDWVPVLAQDAEVVDLDLLDGLSAFHFLYRRYGSRFKGAVIYDPQVPDTINLATMIAGLEDRIILAPQQLALPGIPAFDSLTDLRQLVREQGWDSSEGSKYRLYQWVHDNLWPRLERRIIGVISPGPPTSLGCADDPDWYFPLGIGARDYIVALRLSALWLSPSEEPQASLFAQFLSEAPSPIPVFGNFSCDEEGTTILASRHGDWVASITNAFGPVSVGNLSLTSAVRPQIEPYRAPIDAQRIWDTLGQAPVATIWSSDGDAILLLTQRGFWGIKNWVWEQVQGHRFGWTINPVLIDLAPTIWNYYMRTRDEVAFLGGLSGAGYMYPFYMSDAQLQAYIAHTKGYFQATGLRSTHVDERGGNLDARTATIYYQGLRNAGFLGIMGMAGAPPYQLNFTYAGTPLPIGRVAYLLGGSNGPQILQDLLTQNPGEILLDLPEYPNHEGQVIDDPDAVGGQAVRFSRPLLPNCCMVFAGPGATLAPGDYTLTFRLKVADNQDQRQLGWVGILVQEPGGMSVCHDIAPADFHRAGQYQDVVVTFHLDRFVHNVEAWIDYYGGMPGNPDTDLYADTVHLARQGGAAMPVFAPIFLSVMPAERLTEAPRLADDLEAAGAVVLTPDEFLAALNPEFMIEWATPFLGQGHAALVQAQALLHQGRYEDSLYTVREALKQLPAQTSQTRANKDTRSKP